MIMQNAVYSLIGLYNTRKLIHCLMVELSLAMRPVFSLMDSSASRTVRFGRYQSTWGSIEAIEYRKNDCVVQMLVWRYILAIFLENKNDSSTTVNGERYRDMINNFLWTSVHAMETEDMRFQQNGASCHMAQATNARDGPSSLEIWWQSYLAGRQCWLAPKIVRYNAFKLLFLGLS